MKYQYIAIEREYGSGGQMIAERLAELSGIPCFGREILERVARQMNLSVSQIEDCEERATGSILYSLYAMSQMQTGNGNLLPLEGRVFLAEQKTIRDMAAYGTGVFIGHCAAEALQDRQGVLRVFIRADEKIKTQRIAETYGINERDIKKMIQKFDRKRANYYKANTNREWRSPGNYDLVLDSGTLGTEICTSILLHIIKGDTLNIQTE